jgi:hypothetical protein
LSPNEKDTRRLFGFLFEFLFKNEEDSGKGKALPSNEFDVLLKRRLLKWQSKPWIMPEFLKVKKPLFTGAGEKI